MDNVVMKTYVAAYISVVLHLAFDQKDHTIQIQNIIQIQINFTKKKTLKIASFS